MKTEVAFFSEGEKLAATLCLPGGAQGKVPAVALLHGYGSFRDELTGYTELSSLLAKQGIASLRFDFRGCGASGEPGRMHPHDDWVEDAAAALSYLEVHPRVDFGRLGLVGMSVGGGVVVQAAALDHRVRCVVSLAPVADGGWWLKHLWKTSQGDDAWQDFLNRLSEDRRRRAKDGNSQRVPTEDILAYGPEDMAARRLMLEKYPQFATHTYLSSADSLRSFQPRQFVHLVAPRPVRFVHSLADTSVPIEHSYELFGRAGEVRDIRVIHDSPHCFWLSEQNREVQGLVLDWLIRYL